MDKKFVDKSTFNDLKNYDKVPLFKKSDSSSSLNFLEIKSNEQQI